MPLVDDGVGPFPPDRDPDEYDRLRRRVLWSLPTGLFVIGSRSGDRRNMMTANWVMQIATSPKLVAVAVERGSVTRRLIEEGGAGALPVRRGGVVGLRGAPGLSVGRGGGRRRGQPRALRRRGGRRRRAGRAQPAT